MPKGRDDDDDDESEADRYCLCKLISRSFVPSVDDSIDRRIKEKEAATIAGNFADDDRA